MTRVANNAFVRAELDLLSEVRSSTQLLETAVQDFNESMSELAKAKFSLECKQKRVDDLTLRVSQYESSLRSLREKLRIILEPPPLISLPVGEERCILNDDEEITCRQQ